MKIRDLVNVYSLEVTDPTAKKGKRLATGVPKPVRQRVRATVGQAPVRQSILLISDLRFRTNVCVRAAASCSGTQVTDVIAAAVAAYPRLFRWADEGRTDFVMLGWTESKRNQVLFHNASMTAAHMSLREISERRALVMSQAAPRGPDHRAAGAAAAPQPEERPGDVTPPAGHVREED